MFEYLKIEGFRSLRFVELDEFPPVAVLIGPNGSGKSNLLDLLSFLSEAAAGHLAEAIARRGGFDEVAFKDPGPLLPPPDYSNDIFTEPPIPAAG